MCNKNVKFRTDMWSNTKMKIINKLEERDSVFYVWFRIVNLATVVDDKGYLYVTENIPYTVNLLSIEFDRPVDEIKLALNILLRLEMIEYIENRIFKVKNWSRYQISEKAQINEEENAKNMNNDNTKANDIDKKVLSSKEECKANGLAKLEKILSDVNPVLNLNIEKDDSNLDRQQNNNENGAKNIENIVKDCALKSISSNVPENEKLKENNKKDTIMMPENYNKKLLKKSKNNMEMAKSHKKEKIEEVITFCDEYIVPDDQVVIKEFVFKENDKGKIDCINSN